MQQKKLIIYVIYKLAVNYVIFELNKWQTRDRIYEKFKSFGSVEISDYSHKEKGYNATKTGQIISYAYAMDIELN